MMCHYRFWVWFAHHDFGEAILGEDIFYKEGRTLKQVAQKSYGCLIPEIFQEEAGWSLATLLSLPVAREQDYIIFEGPF